MKTIGMSSVATLTPEMLNPVVDGLLANLNVILPVGLGLFALILGVKLLPSIISKFTNV